MTEPNDDGTAAAGGALSMSIKILHSFPFNPDLRYNSIGLIFFRGGLID